MAEQEQNVCIIYGEEDNNRIESRVLEERIQKAVRDGYRDLEVWSLGHHGIGGRLWAAGEDPVRVIVTGPPGQRTGSMGFPNTRIEVMGNASDDVGWLNAGAEIVVHGHATNGAANAMAQGKIYVAGDIGARGMNMTKHNPRFHPPELWVLGSAGDYFAEFMAGGTAVICGHEPQNPDNILGYRPCVGMVGGKIFFRGPHKGFSEVDARQRDLGEQEWSWLKENLWQYLQSIRREDLYDRLSERGEWQVIAAKGVHEKKSAPKRGMHEFRYGIWEQELGQGGLIGDISSADRSPIPLIATGDMRRFVPVWENRKYSAPCESTCPTGMPVQDRWGLIREGRVEEAVDLAMAYTPFPTAVCGYLCPNLCMQGCTRQEKGMPAVDVTKLGKSSLEAKAPEMPPVTGKKIAVVGGGPAGISVAWQLRLMGQEAVVYDMEGQLGGKISQVIPRDRIPQEVLDKEISRVRDILSHVSLDKPMQGEDVKALQKDYDYVVLAAGAHDPNMLPVPGKEKAYPALKFLSLAQEGGVKVGKRIVIIGAGNVGCDVATVASGMGAEDITLIDIQEPASFGKEREEAEKAGAKFRWPVFTQEINQEGVLLKDGELIPADTVVISVGDRPDSSILPDTVEVENGFVLVDENYRTSDSRIFAIGDIVKPGLITEAIGAGRKAATAIQELAAGRTPRAEESQMIDKNRITLEYFDQRKETFTDIHDCAGECASCGTCRDCGVCATICPVAAISRQQDPDGSFQMVVDENRCIGCGFCARACPCGIWNMVENTPLQEA